MNPKVFIVVLNWNGYRDTIECIESLKKVTYPNYGIVVVDNGSTDGSERILRERFPDIFFIQTGENLGFAGGNNVGIRHALMNGANYGLILNNDTVVDPEFVTELVKVAESDKSIGILSSMIYFYDKPDTIWFAGAYFNLKTGRTKHVGYNKRDFGQYDTITEIDRACGCSMMVTRELCDKVGLMNVNYFCYGEEVDWSFRARKASFKVVFVPNSKVWHKITGSSGGYKSGKYLYYAVRNHLKILEEHSSIKGSSLKFVRTVYVISLYFFCLFTLKISKVEGIRSIYRGAKAYIKDEFLKLDEATSLKDTPDKLR